MNPEKRKRLIEVLKTIKYSTQPVQGTDTQVVKELWQMADTIIWSMSDRIEYPEYDKKA